MSINLAFATENKDEEAIFALLKFVVPRQAEVEVSKALLVFAKARVTA